jgi:hypothetical protein
MKVCRYCKTEKPDSTFQVAAIIKGKIYRRHKCTPCKSARQRERIVESRKWLIEYKKTLCCERCGFSDYRALKFQQ